jgi:hypothetical protein
MKNILKLLVLALLLSPTTFVLAQTDTTKSTTPPATDSVVTTAPAKTETPPKSAGRKKLYKGIRFGYQDSNFSESDGDDLSSWYAGFFGVKSLGAGKLLSIYSGIEYFQNGTSNDGDNEIILGYISIPVNLRVQIGPLYAFAGFDPSFKVYEKVTILPQDVDNFDINGFDIGGQIGIGAKFLFLGAEIKYNQGLTSVFTDAGDKENTSHHIQAGLCVYF